MDKYFNGFLNDNGFAPAIDATPVDSETLAYYRDKLPESLLGYWQEYGFCGFGEGLVWLTNPRDYQDLMEDYLKQTPLWGMGNFYVIARSAFGTLYLYNDTSAFYYDCTIIDPFDSTIIPCDFPVEPPTKKLQSDTLAIFFGTTDKEFFDMTDREDNSLFQNCLKKLGPLSHNEMYTFVPALALGGRINIEQAQKVTIHEQLDILSSFESVTLLPSNRAYYESLEGENE